MNYPEYLKGIIPNKYHKYLIDYQKLSDLLHEKDFVEKFEYSFIKSFDEEYSKFTEVYDNEYHILYFKYLDLMNVEADFNGLLCNGMCLDEDINDLLKYVTGNINGLKKLAKKHDLLSSNEIYSIFRKRFRGDVSKINSLKNDMEILLKEIKNQNSSNIFIQKYKRNTFLMINGNKDLSKYYETCDNKEIENSETNRISEIYLDNDNFDVYTATLYLNIQSSIIKMTWVLNNPTNYILVSKKTIDNNNEEYEIDFKLERKNLLDFLNQKDVWEDICDLNLNNEYVRACYYEIKNDLKNKSLKIKCKISYTVLKIKRSDCNCEFSLKYDIIIHKLDNNLLETEDDVLMKVPYGIITLKYSEDEEKITQILERLRSANIEEYNYFNLFVFSTIMIYEDVKEIPKWVHHLSIKRLKQDFNEQIQQNEEIIEIYNNSKEASRFNNGSLFDFERDTFEQRIIVVNTNKFLNWLCFSVILGGIGALTISLDSALFIFGGTCLVLLSLLSCFYAVYLYFKKKNYSHENINYLELPVLDDPVALVGVIFFILIVSLISFLP